MDGWKPIALAAATDCDVDAVEYFKGWQTWLIYIDLFSNQKHEAETVAVITKNHMALPRAWIKFDPTAGHGAGRSRVEAWRELH
jgi:hypothetical protein